MNRKLKTLLLSALLLSAMVPATAQRWVEIADGATPVICISETVNEAPDVVEIFQNTQSGISTMRVHRVSSLSIRRVSGAWA